MLRIEYSVLDLVKSEGKTGVGFADTGFAPDSSGAHSVGDVLSPIMKFSGLGVESCAGGDLRATGEIREIHLRETGEESSPIMGDCFLYLTTQDDITLPAKNSPLTDITAGNIDMSKIISIIDLSLHQWRDVDEYSAMKTASVDYISYVAEGDSIYGFLVADSADTYNANGNITVDILAARY